MPAIAPTRIVAAATCITRRTRETSRGSAARFHRATNRTSALAVTAASALRVTFPPRSRLPSAPRSNHPVMRADSRLRSPRPERTRRTIADATMYA